MFMNKTERYENMGKWCFSTFLVQDKGYQVETYWYWLQLFILSFLSFTNVDVEINF